VLVGPIEAGEKVVASSRKAAARLIKKNYGDTVAVEMEGRGFLEGVHINSPAKPPAMPERIEAVLRFRDQSNG
jgi:hypothetical protein